MKKSGYQDYRWMASLCVLLMFLVSCESRDKYAGFYEAQATSSAKQGVTIFVELRANGDGLWRVSSHEGAETFGEVPFRWHIRRGDIRVHTRAGGVIVGKIIDKDTVQIILPDSRALIFKKTR
jgi:hypothetical protein